MDLTVNPRWLGVKEDSVLEHRQVNGADIFRVRLDNEPQLRQAFESRAAAKAQLPDGDDFKTEYVLDSEIRMFDAQGMDKRRLLEENVRLSWRLQAQSFPPQSAFGAAIEYFSFLIFDEYSGVEFDLSAPQDGYQSRMLSYVLGYENGDDTVTLVSRNATRGTFKCNHQRISPDAMELIATFRNVVVDMPNIHDLFEQAPDRPFQVYVRWGTYDLTGFSQD
ncbi:hypothetical protein CSV86_005670 [Pseudomonas putida CSV86]|uniref:Uncharacterized protein n=1 Tax=Pseudomonas bharatica CSV86 TaxID=1005395 RepID=L1LTY6_9PSED|nr:hypothetical protein [Pseudomonas bharatica]NNJ14767.1 hypothetical protein [Pseudomonas bharatica CSV86]